MMQSALAQVQLFEPVRLILFFTPPGEVWNTSDMEEDEPGFLLFGPLDGESHTGPGVPAKVCRDQYL